MNAILLKCPDQRVCSSSSNWKFVNYVDPLSNKMVIEKTSIEGLEG